MGFDSQVCDEQLTKKGLRVCGGSSSDHHCIDFNNTPAHAALCPDPSSEHIYDPISSTECYSKVTGEIYFTSIDNIVSDCLAKAQAEPQKQWSLRSCYCCCSCFAYGTPIATPEGMKAIEEFVVNDSVLVASPVTGDSGGLQLDWSPKTIKFSSGTGPQSSQAIMVYVLYGDDKGIVVTPDHVFLMPDGKLKRADRLVPFTDQLVLAEGGTAPIHAVRLGTYKGGIHHIATDLSFDNKVEGHLLNANGVVCADYLLQIHFSQLSDELKADNHSELPVLGTTEYAQRYAHLAVTGFSAFSETHPALKITVKGFKAYGEEHRAIPDSAKAFINPRQEADIIANPEAKKMMPTETIGISMVNYLTKIYNAFYPDVWFHLAWDDIHINSYAFREFDRNIVYIPGGLVRLESLNLEGLALIMAQQIAHFYGGEPQDANGYSTRGQADYYGVLKISRDAFFGDAWFKVAMSGLAQLETFFGFISADNAAGQPGNGDDPAVACRLQTYQVALSGGSLPPCAGGVVPHKLEVVSAEADTSTALAAIVVTFNLPVDQKSAEVVTHYHLQPEADILSAKASSTDSAKVVLTANLVGATDYVLSVSRVTTTDGSNLNSDKTTASFTTGTPV